MYTPTQMYTYAYICMYIYIYHSHYHNPSVHGIIQAFKKNKLATLGDSADDKLSHKCNRESSLCPDITGMN